MVTLTKDADKLICVLYKEFLARRKKGTSKADARHFPDGTIESFDPISKWLPSDVSDAMLELARADLLRITIDGDCNLTDSAIICMENRFKDGLKEVLVFISNFIP